MPRDLYRELQTAVHDDEDFERALEIVDTIIAQDGADPTLLSARLCCLLETRAYAEARALMEDNNMVSSRPYSYAYCLYRVHALAECSDVINQHISKGGDLGARMTLLQAQLLYRMEDYSGAEEAYEAIRASGDFAGDPAELEANLLAARSQTATTLAAASRGVEHESFDIVYNRACAAIGAGNLDAAWELLQVAETECRETLAADDYTDEEIAAEVTAILAQQGYVLHAMGREQEAMDRYNEILDLKPDPVVYAVVGNNIVCLKKEQKLFDSFKKAQKANDVLLQQKLTQGQKQGIAVNRALLFLYMGKRDQCRAVVDTLRATHPDDDLPVLVLAALAVREKKAQRGIDTLRDFLADKADVLDDGACQRVSLALAQILLNEGKRGEAVEALQLAPGGLAHEPAVVATIVSIFTSQGDAEAAFSLVQEAVDYWRSDEAAADHPGDAAGVARVAAAIARENAKLQLRHSRFQNAVALYEDMVRARPDDLVSLANLVVAEALIDAPAAARHARSLPAFEARALSADEVDNLESEPQRVFRRKGKGAAGAGRNGGGDEDGGDGGDEAGGPAAKGADGKGSRRPRQRKKRKPRLPKNFDPNVMPDPERWLPMQERSYYRGKKRRKGKKAGRGGQGVTNEEMANKLQESTAPANSNTGGRRMGKNKRRGRRR